MLTCPSDFDPEDAGVYASESDNSDSNDDDAPANKARDHYEDVGKSKLRKPQAVTLGPQYAGARVHRDAIEEEEEDDPFGREYSDEDSEVDVFGNASEGVDNEGMADGLDHSSQDDDEGSDQDTDLTDDDGGADEDQEASGTIDRSELRKLMADDQKSVAATLTQSAKADADKGNAVKAQRATFDALLNSRIKLQKALVATNSIIAVDSAPKAKKEAGAVIEATEAAAIKFWNNLNALSTTLQ